MAHQACDLNVVHRHDHRTRRAFPPQGDEAVGHLSDRRPSPAGLGRDQCGEQSLGAQRLDRLDREPASLVDIAGCGSGHFVRYRGHSSRDITRTSHRLRHACTAHHPLILQSTR